jgi:hypothetical protein
VLSSHHKLLTRPMVTAGPKTGVLTCTHSAGREGASYVNYHAAIAARRQHTYVSNACGAWPTCKPTYSNGQPSTVGPGNAQLPLGPHPRRGSYLNPNCRHTSHLLHKPSTPD